MKIVDAACERLDGVFYRSVHVCELVVARLGTEPLLHVEMKDLFVEVERASNPDRPQIDVEVLSFVRNTICNCDDLNSHPFPIGLKHSRQRTRLLWRRYCKARRHSQRAQEKE